MSAFDMKTQYSRIFSHIYEYFIAPAVFRALQDDIEGDFILRLPERSRILDVGCGGGDHAIAIGRLRSDLQILGLDVSPQLVEYSRRKARSEGLADRVQFIEGTALELPFEDESFDHVYSSGMLKHLGDKHAMRAGLREWLRVLRPSGHLLVAEADRGARYEDIVRWAANSRVPRPLLPVLHIYFSTYVISQSIDLDDARELWAELPIVNKDGPRRVNGQPALVMTGTRPARSGATQ